MAVRPRGVATGSSRPWRNRLVWGRVITEMPAAATSAATAACTSGGCIPRLTQWLAATSPSKPLSLTWRASSRRVNTDGSSVSSVCRSMSRPADVASASTSEMWAGGSS